jgi:sugar (pentulose or hexulose) kinase
VVFELYYLYEKLASSESDNKSIIAAGGGFSSPLWTQIAADIFGRDIKITQYQEQAALGAALIAGVAIGYYKNMKEACENVKYSPNVVNPKKENVSRYKEIYETIYRKHLA